MTTDGRVRLSTYGMVSGRVVVSDAEVRTGQIDVGGLVMFSYAVGLSRWGPRVVSAVTGCD